MNPLIRLERTTDPDPVNRIINHPDIFDLVRVDGATHPVDMSPLVEDTCNVFLLAHVNQSLAGIVQFDLEGRGVYDIHPAILPPFQGGEISKDIIHSAMSWMFDHGAVEIIADIPENRRSEPARRMATRVGMRSAGLTPGSFVVDGIAYDERRYSVTHEAFRRSL